MLRKSYKLHYTVLDSLRSSWREFQALHDLGLNVPLLQEILGSDRHFEMALHVPDAAGETLFNPPGGALSRLDDPIMLSSSCALVARAPGDALLHSAIRAERKLRSLDVCMQPARAPPVRYQFQKRVVSRLLCSHANHFLT